MSNAIEITGLTKRFNSFLLNNVSFTVPKGYVMGFIGPNGAGKTTVIKLILNMLRKDSGMIRIFSWDHIDQEEDIKENIGIVFDQCYFLEKWTLKELEKSIRGFYRTWNSEKYYGYLKEFGLDKNQRVKNLSKGMKMKLMIAAALSHDTKLLILDEPTSGLDAVARDELLDILRDYVVDDQRSILISTHITGDLEKIADYITFIYDGEIVYSGAKDELLEDYCIIKGDLSEVDRLGRSRIIGFTEHTNGFEGLLPVSGLKGLSDQIITDPVTLDDLIVFTDRDRKQKRKEGAGR